MGRRPISLDLQSKRVACQARQKKPQQQQQQQERNLANLSIQHPDQTMVFKVDGFESRRASAPRPAGEGKAGRSKRRELGDEMVYAGAPKKDEALYAVRWVPAGQIPAPVKN